MLARWLIAWLIGVIGMAGLVAAVWSLSTYRQLARDGAPEPGKVLRRLWLTPVAWVLRPGGSERGATLTGRRAWVWWDVRWGPSGQSEAIVRGADERHLQLSLVTPVGMYSGSAGGLVGATEVRFTASRLPNYRWGTVSGVLEPVDRPLGQSGTTDPPRARVCVL